MTGCPFCVPHVSSDIWTDGRTPKLLFLSILSTHALSQQRREQAKLSYQCMSSDLVWCAIYPLVLPLLNIIVLVEVGDSTLGRDCWSEGRPKQADVSAQILHYRCWTRSIQQWQVHCRLVYSSSPCHPVCHYFLPVGLFYQVPVNRTHPSPYSSPCPFSHGLHLRS